MLKINALFLYVKSYILVRFIFVLMSHIFIFIYWYGHYFGLIGYIGFKFLMDLILIFYVYKPKCNIMYAVSFIYSNLSPHFSPFESFQGKFISLQGQWPFSTVTTVDDCLFHQTYQFSYHPRV